MTIKLIVISIILVISTKGHVQNYDIKVVRHLNKIELENNTVTTVIKANDLITVQYPKFTKRGGTYQLEKTDHLRITDRIETSLHQWLELIENNKNQWSKQDLKHKINAAKNYHKIPPYYVSDVDTIEVTIEQEGQLIWQITFQNLEKLKYYKKYLKDWAVLIDLVENIEHMSRQANQSNKVEVAQ